MTFFISLLQKDYGCSAQPPPKRELVRECSHGETSTEFADDFPHFWPDWACFRAFALAAGVPSCLQAHAAQSGPAARTTENYQGHLVQKLTLARAFGDQLESGAGKAHLFRGSTVSDHTVMGLAFADHP